MLNVLWLQIQEISSKYLKQKGIHCEKITFYYTCHFRGDRKSYGKKKSCFLWVPPLPRCLTKSRKKKKIASALILSSLPIRTVFLSFKVQFDPAAVILIDPWRRSNPNSPKSFSDLPRTYTQITNNSISTLPYVIFDILMIPHLCMSRFFSNDVIKSKY